jgi:flagellar biosynthetic protein FliR
MTASLMGVEFSLYLLASIRVVGVFATAPLFSHTSIPSQIRAAFSIVVAVAIAPSIESSVNVLEMGALELALAVIREVVIGLALGYVSRLIFAIFGVLGQFISIQGGLGAARVIDPTSGASTVVMGSLLQSIGYLVFLAINGHHAVIRAISESFKLMPIGGPGIDVDALLVVARMASVVFELAVRLAAPVTIAMLVANCSVGLLGRSIPQLNLMTLQLPAHVAIMMLLVAMGARSLVGEVSEILLPWIEDVPAVLAGHR